MKVYLAGKIPKGKELDNYVDWREEYRKILSKSFPDMEYLDPDMDCANYCGMTEADPFFWFGRDSCMIKESDFIIVQADRKLGAGTAQEMLIAKYFLKPVIVILPKNSHHRRNNIMMRSGFVEEWIHPFVGSTADIIVETLEESIDWISQLQKEKLENIKTIGVIDDAIKYYLDIAEKTKKK